MTGEALTDSHSTGSNSVDWWTPVPAITKQLTTSKLRWASTHVHMTGEALADAHSAGIYSVDWCAPAAATEMFKLYL